MPVPQLKEAEIEKVPGDPLPKAPEAARKLHYRRETTERAFASVSVPRDPLRAVLGAKAS